MNTSTNPTPQPSLIALSEAATPGPWKHGVVDEQWGLFHKRGGCIAQMGPYGLTVDGEFIVALVNWFRAIQSRPGSAVVSTEKAITMALQHIRICAPDAAVEAALEAIDLGALSRPEAELPELPEPDGFIKRPSAENSHNRSEPYYFASKLRAYGQQCAATRPAEVGGSVRASDLELIVAQMREEGSHAFNYYAQRISNLCTPAQGSEPDALQHKHEMGPPKSGSEVRP